MQYTHYTVCVVGVIATLQSLSMQFALKQNAACLLLSPTVWELVLSAVHINSVCGNLVPPLDTPTTLLWLQ